MNWSVVVPIIAAVIAGCFAIVAARVGREVRNSVTDREDERHDLRVARKQIEDLQADVLTLKRFVFTLRAKLADANVRTAEMPRLKSEEWDA